MPPSPPFQYKKQLICFGGIRFFLFIQAEILSKLVQVAELREGNH